MEQRYDIRTKLTEPSAEQIDKHRDFDALLRQFEAKKPESAPATTAKVVRMRPWIYPVLSTAAAVALLLIAYFSFYGGSGAPVDSEAYFADRPYVDPPELAGGQAPTYRVQTVNNTTGGELVLPSGARLVVPEYAFAIDRGGQPVAGEVLIHYRELLDFVDFFQAGIPMEYDNPEKLDYLDPAGIVDIYAEQDGRRLSLAAGKTMEVSFTSAVQTRPDGTLPQLVVYYLDESARRWVYQGLDRITDLTTQTDRANDRSGVADAEARWRAANPAPVRPAEPRATTGDNRTLQLDFINDLELAPGSDVAPQQLRAINASGIWEILPETGDFNANAFDVTWEQVRLERLAGDKFALTLLHPQNELRLIVQPVLSTAELQAARAAYQEALAAYEADSAEWADQLSFVRTEAARSLTPDTEKETDKRTVRHQFGVDRLGIYTVAQAIDPDLRPAKLTLRDRSGRFLNEQPVYVVNSRGNTIYRYLAGDPNWPVLPATGDNLLWTVDAQGRISTYHVAEGEEIEGEVLRSLETGSTADPREVLRF